MSVRTKAIEYRNEDLKLAGDILIPTGECKAGTVFIHGSGKSDRTNPWYREIAEYLAHHQIGVLLSDKRGCNESEGDWRTADFHDLAEDAIAGVEALRNHAKIATDLIGLIGVSQGGWVAPIAAHERNVSFVVNLSGATVRPREQFHHEVMNDIRQMRLPGWLVHVYFPLAELFLRRKWPAWHDVRFFDPVPLWKSLPAPGLLVFGEEDEYDNVPVKESIRRIKDIIEEANGCQLTIKIYPRSGHALREPNGKQIRPDVLESLVEWIINVSRKGA
ncbi:MAG: alpha/beta fold hydrolase [Candidatus Korarchaeota archaeon]|nr:alpha/beta fold hydrolase [Candidatus Korarchaeota archaeon]NIU84477.1 alpha/beta fold hydrolase [Candidatus Thorarchaeota archaeon]NIW14553.1 alpha/beta fold hydrolase [Candidatus Thorarchaeota archaeon]NIW52625.1 alpha/beta fold hydrolase [Candidatus Korarchaeota archaeon]